MSLHDDYDSESAYVLMGVACSILVGFVVGVFVGFGVHDVLAGFYAFVGIALLCLHLFFWRVGE